MLSCVYILKQTIPLATTPFLLAKNTPDNLMTWVTLQDDKQTNSPVRAKVEMQNENIAAYYF